MKTKKRNNSTRKRAVFTGLVLLFLVVAAAWTLKTRDSAEEAEPEVPTAEVEVVEPKTEVPVQEEKEEETKEKPDTSNLEEDERAALEKSLFLPDYESFPLLSTTPIKYLTMEVGATENEVRFNWMSTSSQPGIVTWYTVQNGDYKTYTAECTASSTMPGYYVNKATVTDVAAGFTYAYKVGNDAGGWSPEYHYSVPEESETTTFLVTSDAQIGQAQYEEVQDTIDRWDAVVTRLTEYVPEAQFLFHLGDQVADYGSAEHYDGYLNHLGLYKIPLAPVVGNHDVPNESSMEKLGHAGLPYFYEHFNVPNRSESIGMSAYDKDGDYCFVRGDVLFIVLNSNTSQETDIHCDYVPQAISMYPDAKWRVIVQHHPAYSSVAKYQPSSEQYYEGYLAYVADRYDIDLVLTGHDHLYSRSKITYVKNQKITINEDYDYASGSTAVNPNGCLYVTCSTASGCIYQAVTENERLAVQGQPETPVAIRIDVTENELHLTSYLVDSWTVYDEYTIRKE